MRRNLVRKYADVGTNARTNNRLKNLKEETKYDLLLLVAVLLAVSMIAVYYGWQISSQNAMDSRRELLLSSSLSVRW